MAWVVKKPFTDGSGAKYAVGDKVTDEKAKDLNLAKKPDLAKTDKK